MIAVGAAMVSSIVVDESMQEGAQVHKGDEHGCFRFGGSTLILLFDAHAIAWDDDLVAASRKPIETYVRCGTQIGRTRAVRRQEEAAAAAAAQMRRPPPFDVTALGAVAPARVLSPSPSPTSPRLVLTATTDAGRKEAALNDEGLLSDMPVLQSNLTLMPRDGDTEPARGVPHMTDAAADAADAVNADVPDRGEERSVGESLEAFLPSFLQPSSPSPPSSPEEDHSRDLESPSSRRGLLESHRAEWQQQDASSRSRAAAAAAAGVSGRVRVEDETHVRAPAPAVFQLMHFTADEDSSSANSGEEEDEHDEEMGAREDGAAAQHYQQREEPNQAARAHSNNTEGAGSRNKRMQSQPQHPSASSAAAAAAPSSSSTASATSSPSRQAGRRRSRASAAADNSSNSRQGNSASSRMGDTEAASIADEQQQDDDEELPAAKKKKRAARSRK
jgi:hypothetical protein